ncbi:HAD hydrolase family protein [Lachnobacterium bovis]|uniref:Hydroxymethylpyrimidine pyrophosphatase n=1 Tax=Lachnobacterium bovis TaxID=140626 RepID=A0A1H9RS48_9FIRM|nr:HAD hydrolase family protein [Lachnobacterium bovis]SER74953.1 Hydroxymethylpyrimidine pyrophosphatase [Lachnobacterium bovis]
MTILFSDLDKTLIYSYKHDIGKQKELVEMYQGREVSYMSKKSVQAMKKIMGTRKIAKENDVLFVPTTTRTIMQYNRINLPIENPKYALVCNGGILLEEGEINKKWYQESLELIEDSNEEMRKAIEILENDELVNFEIRYIEKLFVFTKSKDPQKTIDKLKKKVDSDKVDVFFNGVKVYAVPKELTKGNALKRFVAFYEKLKAEKNNVDKNNTKKINPVKLNGKHINTIAAGDSLFDISMLESADKAFAPINLADKINKKVNVCPENELLSERILCSIIKDIRQ